MTEQRMTEQNGHEEHERNSARDGDAGFAALDAPKSCKRVATGFVS